MVVIIDLTLFLEFLHSFLNLCTLSNVLLELAQIVVLLLLKPLLHLVLDLADKIRCRLLQLFLLGRFAILCLSHLALKVFHSMSYIFTLCVIAFVQVMMAPKTFRFSTGTIATDRRIYSFVSNGLRLTSKILPTTVVIRAILIK